ncbi:sulfotransferase [Dietzia massiliensis]|uniref:sulfotransferase n=1 Tax=Dietzia massiliensis TaxID=2697499 RepID=UPI001BCF6042|nr:sulfotransferase [Dietzia massiliensis]MBS7548319.1 sulfotransferase [Dietzia massiliensis]
MNTALESEFARDTPGRSDLPTAQIVGLPRSGTTILYQVLARTARFGYPSNVMAFFWKAPHVGAYLQQRLSLAAPELELHSLAGRTREPLGPHEFGYFWRNALGHSRNSVAPDRAPMRPQELQNTLSLINSAFDKPTVFKNLLAVSHVELFGTQLQNQYFLNIVREPIEVAASLLLVRDRLGLDVNEWFGTIPADDNILFDNEIKQVTHQVQSLTSTIRASGIHSQSFCLTIDYRDLCARPRSVAQEAGDFVGEVVSNSDLERLPETLTPSTPLDRLSPERRKLLIKSFG